MPRRAALAAVLVLLSTLSGCADEPSSTGSAAPTASPTASPSRDAATPAPAPSGSTGAPGGPTQTPAKKPASRSKGGPLGSVRTTGVRAVAVTFDDGPHPEWTPKVLAHLRKAKVKATFCVVGVKVRSHPELVARIVREGHSLCNHSWAHDLKLGEKSAARIRADLRRTNQEIRRAAPGARVRYYRQPGGLWSPTVIKVARELGMTPLHWDVDPGDWAKPTAAVISKRVARQVRAGSIVLLHDGGGDRRHTTLACPEILRTLKRKYGITRL